VEMIFVRVPAGTLMLGSPSTEVRRVSNETLHEYSRAEGFLMAATEVTQTQYKAITGSSPSHHKGDMQRPVEQVTFGATAIFLTEFNKRLREQGLVKWKAVLPSDDEWEYACRAGTLTPFHNETKLTNTGAATISKIAVCQARETAPVGRLVPNAFGLYDMHGNVAEWTSSGTLRGGAFYDSPTECRAAARLRSQESKVEKGYGFRIMLQTVKPSAP